MSILRRLYNRSKVLFRNRKLEDDLEDELKFHLEMEIEKNRERGLSAQEARRTALLTFGGVEQIKEECREAWGTRWILDIGRDFRLGLRLLRKNKGFTTAVLLTLGLCIAGNTIVFSILDAVLGPPSYPEPDRVVEIYNSYPGTGLDRFSSNIALYLDFSENTEAFTDLALVQGTTVNMMLNNTTARSRGLRVTPDYFEMLQVQPLIGTLFNEVDQVHGNSNVIVLTESHWRTKFESDPNVVGLSLRMDNSPFTIIGVAPESASMHYENRNFYQAWTWSAENAQNQKDNRHSNYAQLWGRLKPGISIAQAQAQVNVLDKRFYDRTIPLLQDYLDRHQHESKIETFQEASADIFGRSLYLLQGSVLLVFLIGCINIANLQLTRGLGRLSEFAMRKALGASHLALMRQLLMENVALVIGSCFLGILLAWGGLIITNQYLIRDLLPQIANIGLSNFSLFLTFGLSTAVAVLLGFISLIPVLRENLTDFIHEGGRKATTGKSMKALRSILVSAQVALSLILLSGAGLLMQSFIHALNTDAGFDSHNISTTSFGLPSLAYNDSDDIIKFRSDLKAILNEIPSIGSLSFSSNIPVIYNDENWAVSIPGYELVDGEGFPSVNINIVSDGYFETLGIPILSGRFMNTSDIASDTINVIVDREFSERYFHGRNPIGSKITFDPRLPMEEMPTIVGVVENVKHSGLDREEIQSQDRGRYPMVYLPMNPKYTRNNIIILIKSERAHEDLLPIVRSKIHELDPHLPLFRTGQLDTMLRDSLNSRRAFMLLIIILAAMALLQSAIGIYGVLAYDVAQHTREIGLRIAIGAPRGIVLKQVIRQGMSKVVMGLTVGLICAWIFSGYLSEFLYQVKPTEPLAYIAVTLFLAIIALIASYLPARKATLIDPMEALRSE